MTDWHVDLARALVPEAPAGFAPDGAASLEIALGHARSAISYALELARAHRIPANGRVCGDDVWMVLGDRRVRFTLNRRERRVVVARSGHDEMRAEWEATKRAIVDGGGGIVDLGAVAREAIDGIVNEWRALGAERDPSSPPPDFDDTPTKN